MLRLYREAYSGKWRLKRACTCGHGDLPAGFHFGGTGGTCPRGRR